MSCLINLRERVSLPRSTWGRGIIKFVLRPMISLRPSFVLKSGHFEFLVVPLGLTNASSTFMTLMDSVLRPYLGKFIVVFVDDILIYSASKEEHLYHFCLIFESLKANKIYAKKSKCNFFKTKIHYLGHIITNKGIMIDTAKVEAIMRIILILLI